MDWRQSFIRHGKASFLFYSSGQRHYIILNTAFLFQMVKPVKNSHFRRENEQQYTLGKIEFGVGYKGETNLRLVMLSDLLSIPTARKFKPMRFQEAPVQGQKSLHGLVWLLRLRWMTDTASYCPLVVACSLMLRNCVKPRHDLWLPLAMPSSKAPEFRLTNIVSSPHSTFMYCFCLRRIANSYEGGVSIPLENPATLPAHVRDGFEQGNCPRS